MFDTTTPPSPHSGRTGAAISHALVSLYRERYGKRPSKAKTYLLHDLENIAARATGDELDEPR